MQTRKQELKQTIIEHYLGLRVYEKLSKNPEYLEADKRTEELREDPSWNE